MKTIAVTGPESTGKTTLVKALGDYFNCPVIFEYARGYVEGLKRKYTFEDVEHIAETQSKKINEIKSEENDFSFIDTYLIITKIWFLEVFNEYPKWIDKEIGKGNIDLYLVCDIDIPWRPDSVRENGGENRKYLLGRYIEELNYFKLPYRMVYGKGEKRLKLALQQIKDFFI